MRIMFSESGCAVAPDIPSGWLQDKDAETEAKSPQEKLLQLALSRKVSEDTLASTLQVELIRLASRVISHRRN